MGSVITDGSTAVRSVGESPSPAVTVPRVNRLALSTLMASRRPIFIWASSTAVSVPGRPLAAQYRTASAPNFSSIGRGVTTLPLDLDIFLRSGSSTHPEMATLVHGSASCCRCARSTVENSHVRMMS